MNRPIWTIATAAGCLIGALAGHHFGRSSFVAEAPPQTVAPPAPDETPAAPSPDPKGLIAEALAALRQRDKPKFDTATAAMDSLDDDGLQVALAESKKIFNRDERRGLMSELIAVLAERDPDAAINFLKTNVSSFEQWEFARPVFMAIIDKIGAEAALALYHEHKLVTQGQLGISSLFPIFSRLGQEDIDAAIAATATIEGQGNRRQMISSICESSTDPEKREKLLAWANTLTDQDEQAHAFGHLIEVWARRENPDVALAWAEENTLPAASITSIEQNVSTIQFGEDPQGAAEWLLARATPENRADHMAFIVGRWVNSAPNAAGEWLGGQTLDATADKALSRFARAIAREDPESAHAWTQRITDPDHRSEALKHVMMWWKRLDPEAAAAAESS